MTVNENANYWLAEDSLTFEAEFGVTFVTCHCGTPMIEDSYEVPHGDTTGSQKCYACELCGEIIDRIEGVREDGWPDGISEPESGKE